MLGLYALCALTGLMGHSHAQTWSQVGQGPNTARYYAMAELRSADMNGYLIGRVSFVQYTLGAPTTIMAVIQLPLNSFRDQFLALHIHEYGDTSEGCKWVGRHFNPYGQAHGGPMDHVHHAGDLGNVSPTGNLLLINITNPHLQLAGIDTIVGRSIVLHQQHDDQGRGGTANSMIDGNSGYPVACGTIAIKGDFSPAAATSLCPSILLTLSLIVLAKLKV